MITGFGNLLIILAVSSDSYLHTPMYFFLSNLSFVDICFITSGSQPEGRGTASPGGDAVPHHHLTLSVKELTYSSN